jgi:hypothetical protein
MAKNLKKIIIMNLFKESVKREEGCEGEESEREKFLWIKIS